MRFGRRDFLRIVGAVALPVRAFAQAYPTRPIKLVVPFAAGSPPDLVARMVVSAMGDRLGQQMFIENRPGAGAIVGVNSVVRAEPDGHTLVLGVATNTVNASLYKNLEFDFVRDLAPVTSLLRVINILVVHPSLPVHTLPEFIAYVKANPGKLNMASGGSGSAPHVAGEMLKTMAGLEMVHVPYANSYYPDLVAGQVQVVISAVPGVIGFIRSGQLRALAVASEKRWDGLPDLPAIAEVLPGYEASGWYGILAPKATPAPIIEKLYTAFNAAVADPALKARLPELGASEFRSTSAEFGKFVGDEVKKWADVIKAANIRVD